MSEYHKRIKRLFSPVAVLTGMILVVLTGTFLGGTALAQSELTLLTMEYPPQSYTENSEVKGIAVEIVQEAFHRMQQPIDVRIVPWKRGLESVKAGNVDGLFTVYKTPEREEFLNYSEELIQEAVSLFVLHDSQITFDGDLKKLSHYRFGVVRGFSYGEEFDSARKNNIISSLDIVASAELNMEKLLGQRFDIMVSDRFTALQILNKLGAQTAVKEIPPPIEVIPAYLTFSKKRELNSVKEHFNATLVEMKEDGTYDKIIKRFFQ